MKKSTRRLSAPQSLFGAVKKIEALTHSQKLVLELNKKENHQVLFGYPGTGKTYLACYCALDALVKNKNTSIRIIRSSVPSRDIGFLPGSEDEKMAAYERPYISIFNNLMGRGDGYALLKQKGLLHFESSSFLRGMTYDDAVVIVDEFQNMNWQEMNTLVTRMGENSRIFVCGDVTQADLRERETGYYKSMEIFRMIEDFDLTEFGVDDIVRSGLVKQWIMAAEKIKLAA